MLTLDLNLLRGPALEPLSFHQYDDIEFGGRVLFQTSKIKHVLAPKSKSK